MTSRIPVAIPVKIHASRASRPLDAGRFVTTGPAGESSRFCVISGNARFQPIEAMQQRERFLAAARPLCRGEQLPGGRAISARERVRADLQELFRLTLFLRERSLGPLDIRTSSAVGSIEEQYPRPDVDGEIADGLRSNGRDP